MILTFLNQYAQLINIVLFGTIVGFLIKISEMSRTSIVDKFEAKIAAKDQELEHLRQRLELQDVHHKGETTDLERQVDWFKRILDLPQDERTKALENYQEVQLQQYSLRESVATDSETKQAIREEKTEFQDAVNLAKTIDPAVLANVARVLVRFIVPF